MPWNLAIHGTLGMWPALLKGNVSSQHFYLHSMGLDDPRKSLRLMIAWTAAWCLPIASFAGWAMRPKPTRTIPALLIAFFLGAIFVGWQWKLRDWPSMFRPLPLLVAAIIVISIIQHFRHRSSDGVQRLFLASEISPPHPVPGNLTLFSPLPVLWERVRVRAVHQLSHEKALHLNNQTPALPRCSAFSVSFSSPKSSSTPGSFTTAAGSPCPRQCSSSSHSSVGFPQQSEDMAVAPPHSYPASAEPGPRCSSSTLPSPARQ